MSKIMISSGDIILEAELNESQTARKMNAVPVTRLNQNHLPTSNIFHLNFARQSGLQG